MQNGLWLQERVAPAFDAWSLLAKAFGVSYGVKGGSSWRWMMADFGGGSIRHSLHKTGLAIDLAGGGGDSIPLPKFPIRIEAEWLPNRRWSMKKASDEDKDAGKLTHDLYWKLYGHSDYDVFDDAEDLAEVRERLRGMANGGLRRAYRRELRGIPEDAAAAWMDRRLARHERTARELADLDDEALLGTYFRRTIRHFRWNAYEADAGTSGPEERPSRGKSFFNLSALAHPLGIERIGAHHESVRNQDFLDDALGRKRAQRVSVGFGTFFGKKTAINKGLKILAMLSVSRSAAPELRSHDEPFTISTGSGKKRAVVARIRLDEIDRDLIARWRREIPAISSTLYVVGRRRRRKGPPVPRGAQVRVSVGVGESERAILDAVLALLEGDLADRPFVATHVGEEIGPHIDQDVVMTGSELAAQIRAGHEDFAETASALARAAKAREAAAEPPPEEENGRRKRKKKKSRRKKGPTRKEREAAQKRRASWSVIFQPVFKKDAGPDEALFLPSHTLELPPGEIEGHLEWWHFQHEDHGANWGALMQGRRVQPPRHARGADRLGRSRPRGPPRRRLLAPAPEQDALEQPRAGDQRAGHAGGRLMAETIHDGMRRYRIRTRAEAPAPGATPIRVTHAWLRRLVSNPMHRATLGRLRGGRARHADRAPSVAELERLFASRLVLEALPLAALPPPASPPEVEEPAAFEGASEEADWIEIELVDPEGNPVPRVRFQLRSSDGRTRSGVLNDNGWARVERLVAGEYEVSFPEWDAYAWKAA